MILLIGIIGTIMTFCVLNARGHLNFGLGLLAFFLWPVALIYSLCKPACRAGVPLQLNITQPPPLPPPLPVVAQNGLVETLASLADLHAKGILGDEEFKLAKAKLLAS